MDRLSHLCRELSLSELRTKNREKKEEKCSITDMPDSKQLV